MNSRIHILNHTIKYIWLTFTNKIQFLFCKFKNTLNLGWLFMKFKFSHKISPAPISITKAKKGKTKGTNESK